MMVIGKYLISKLNLKDKAMEEKKKKFPISMYEIILLLVIIPVVFYYSGKLLWHIEESNTTSDLLRWFTNLLLDMGPLSILGFDILWIIAMKFWPLKSLRIKIYSTAFIFTMSAMLLVSWMAATALRGSMH
jgi:hypothetical protein